MRNELPPFDFKIHLFLDSEAENQEKYTQDMRRDITEKMYEKLKELGAETISDLFMADRPKSDNHDSKKKSSDKIRFLFTSPSEELAMSLYKYFV